MLSVNNMRVAGLRALPLVEQFPISCVDELVWSTMEVCTAKIPRSDNCASCELYLFNCRTQGHMFCSTSVGSALKLLSLAARSSSLVMCP